MTEALKKLMAHASTLPEEKQDFLAAVMLENLEADDRWDELFAHPKSEELLDRLAAEALREHEAGLTQPLDPDAM